MNEILGPIYYTLFTTSENWSAHAEADAFFCFTTLMGDVKDNFMKTLDDSDTGISAYIVMMPSLSPLHAVQARRCG